MPIRKAGAASQSIYVEILDSTSTTGGRKTGLAYNTASLTAYYVRNGGSATSITLATLAAANSAWSSGGFVEVSSTNMPGVYRLDVPDAALATGVPDVTITLKGATGMVQVSVLIELSPGVDVTRWNGTAVPSENTAGYPIVTIKDGTGTGEIDTTSGGVLVAAFANGAITANAIAADAITAAKIADGAIDAATFAAGAITASAIAADAITDAKVASDVTIASVTGAVGSVTGNVGGNVAGSVGSVTASVTVGTNNDKTGYALSSAGVQAIWDVLTSALTTVGSVGKRIADNLDAAISTRLASASYTAPDNTSITAIKAKTDSLTFTSAGKVDATIQAAGDFAQGAADKVWSTATRTLTAIASGILSSAARNEIADSILDRNMATGTDSGSATVRTVRQALRALRNRWDATTVYKEDDTTASWTYTLTTASGNPVTELNPADS